jgi:septal ring factor EnvC (AmiA/AmiB activator)
MIEDETETKEATETERELQQELNQLELDMEDQTELIDELVWTLYQLVHRIDYETKRKRK